MKSYPLQISPSVQSKSVEEGLRRLLDETLRVRAHVIEIASQSAESFEGFHPEWKSGARNLFHYLALRQLDLRQLQLRLSQFGLSSLGRSESHVLSNLNEVIKRIHEALGERSFASNPELPEQLLTFPEAEQALHKHSRSLLGPKPKERHVYIMVTAPAADLATRDWARKLLNAGMNCLRINCAHENRASWLRIIEALRAAEKETGTSCKILMDLGGPKLRTGAIVEDPEVLHLKLPKDCFGKATGVAQVTFASLASLGSGQRGNPGVIYLPQSWLSSLQKGDQVCFRDCRGKRRRIQISGSFADSVMGECQKSFYLRSGTVMRQVRDGKKLTLTDGVRVFAPSAAIEVRPGDVLNLVTGSQKGQHPVLDSKGRLIRPGAVCCTLSAAIRDVAIGERVFIDDGKIECRVESKTGGDVALRVIRASNRRAKIREGKGINLPDTDIQVPSLTDQDTEDLDFVSQHADLVGLSFVRDRRDVANLLSELQERGRSDMGVVIKIETGQAFTHLPEIICEAMRHYPLGIMIARGDLAVECGFERLAELQEEILWMSEAAHVPVIWATQVLESMAQTGAPSRAEVTDAAMSVRAECVMLNKGPYIEETTQSLERILRKMESHQYKKKQLFRRLQVCSSFPQRVHQECRNQASEQAGIMGS